ncbi:MAG: hypothetical protein EOO11_22115 [Chitinophagaceae bacterium]|nr:MAG: hypothetical protein EOO11_22115 [Chitinophagaceae bacterium]
MAYSFHGFIGAEGALSGIRMRFPAAKIIALGQDVFLVPLTGPLQQQMNGGEEPEPLEGFSILTPPMEDVLLEVSGAGTVAYAEVLQWDGSGAAIVWEGGSRQRTYRYGQHLISRLLRSFGVVAHEGQDEFTTMGFAKRRFTDDWLLPG